MSRVVCPSPRTGTVRDDRNSSRPEPFDAPSTPVIAARTARRAPARTFGPCPRLRGDAPDTRRNRWHATPAAGAPPHG